MSPRKTREFHQVPFAEFQVWRDKMPSMTNAELGKEIGYSGSAISSWEREDYVPKAVVLAMETVVARKTPQGEKTHFMVTVDNAAAARVFVDQATQIKGLSVARVTFQG